jgi:glucokinase
MAMAEPVLVADIGGTNARFALAQASGEKIAIRDAKCFRVADFETARDAVRAYLDIVDERPKKACFAAAGPVSGREVDFTNSHWRINADEIEQAFGFERVLLVNDFYALATGVDRLGDDAFVAVKDGTPDPGAPRLALGPGTGFGQALIVPAGDGPVIVSTQGGHVSFAAQTQEEFEMMKIIAREHGRVSVENVLSGPGLTNMYRALCIAAGTAAALSHAEEISAAAIKGEDPMAVKTVHLYCAALGRVAGDAALATGARGGVVLGGGVLPKIRNVFLQSAFVEHFVDKGPMTDYVRAIPVKLIVKEGAALWGAAALLRER